MKFEDFIKALREHGYGIVAMNEYTLSTSVGNNVSDTKKHRIYIVVKKGGESICVKGEGSDYEVVFDKIITEIEGKPRRLTYHPINDQDAWCPECKAYYGRGLVGAETLCEECGKEMKLVGTRDIQDENFVEEVKPMSSNNTLTINETGNGF